MKFKHYEVMTFGFGMAVFLLMLTPARELLETSMTSHIMIEFPLLVLAGCLMALSFKERGAKFFSVFNKGGIPGILIASFALIFWMIPKWLDYSIASESIAVLKVFSITFLVGFPLASSWSLLHPLVAALIKIEFLTMLFRLGWIYLISPDRLCNNYLLSDQMLLGESLLILAAGLSVLWILPLFTGKAFNPGNVMGYSRAILRNQH